MVALRAALFASLVASTALAEPQRLLKPEDSAAIRDVDEPQISPDGNAVVYTVKTVDLEKDKSATNLWRRRRRRFRRS